MNSHAPNFTKEIIAALQYTLQSLVKERLNVKPAKLVGTRRGGVMGTQTLKKIFLEFCFAVWCFVKAESKLPALCNFFAISPVCRADSKLLITVYIYFYFFPIRDPNSIVSCSGLSKTHQNAIASAIYLMHLW